MKRILLMVIKNFWLVPKMWMMLLRHAKHAENYTDSEHHEMIKYIVKRANIGGNVTIQVFGQENIPEENGFIFFPNHQGLYDVLAMVDTCSKPFSVVAKKEVQNVPFLKQVFQCMGALFMDREDVRQSMKIIAEVTRQVENGRNFIIFAEGTRSKNGNQPGEFKAGSFKAATKAKCPIVPVALINAFEPFDSGTTKPVEVQVHYLPPIYYEEYKIWKTAEIAEEVKNRIEKTIKLVYNVSNYKYGKVSPKE